MEPGIPSEAADQPTKPVVELTIEQLVARLREDPADKPALNAVLDYLTERSKAYYRHGELYDVPTSDGMVTKELHSIEDGCQLTCMAKGCPGLLRFRDGSRICPFNWRVVKSVATDPFLEPIKLVQRLLYRGVKKGSVELYDGRTITFNIRKAKD